MQTLKEQHASVSRKQTLLIYADWSTLKAQKYTCAEKVVVLNILFRRKVKKGSFPDSCMHISKHKTSIITCLVLQLASCYPSVNAFIHPSINLPTLHLQTIYFSLLLAHSLCTYKCISLTAKPPIHPLMSLSIYLSIPECSSFVLSSKTNKMET